MANMYRSMKTQQEMSTCTSSDGEQIKRKCLIPGCTENSVNVGPFCRLELCSEHYEEDEKKMVKMCEEALASLSTRIGENGNMKVKLSWLKRQVGRLQEEKEEVGEVFRELEKTLRLKREELEAELEGRIKSFEGLLEFLQELFNLLENQDAKLKGAFQKHDYVSANDAVKQVEKILDSVRTKEKVTKIPSLHVPIQKMLTSINQALKKCVVVDMPVFEEEEISVPLPTQKFQATLEKQSLQVGEKKSVELKKVKNVLHCNNTAGLFHDSSRTEPSYQNVKGCVVRSAEASESMHPLPKDILIVSLDDCSYFLLVYTVEGELVSLIHLSRYSSSFRFVACNSINQTLFFCNHRDDEVSQMSLTGETSYNKSGLKCKGVIAASLCTKSTVEFSSQETSYSRLAVLAKYFNEPHALILATVSVSPCNKSWSQKYEKNYNITEDKKLELQLQCSSVHLDMHKVYLLQETAERKAEIIVLSTETLERLACVGVGDSYVVTISHLMNEFFVVDTRYGRISVLNTLNSKTVTLLNIPQKSWPSHPTVYNSVFFTNTSSAYIIVWSEPHHENTGMDIYQISYTDQTTMVDSASAVTSSESS